MERKGSAKAQHIMWLYKSISRLLTWQILYLKVKTKMSHYQPIVIFVLNQVLYQLDMTREPAESQTHVILMYVCVLCQTTETQS